MGNGGSGAPSLRGLGSASLIDIHCGGDLVQSVIGLMSGTSLDGVDAAVVETDGERIAAFGRRVTVPYDPRLRGRLRALIDRAPRLSPDDPELLAAERALTVVHADAIAALATPATLVGFHGQTILHDPARRRTWQIGDAALLARLTGLPVVHDFRSADVSAGGEGARLVPVFHAALLADDVPRPTAILNIGGVANLTVVPGIGTDGLIACDTGPGNALLDDWAMRHTGVPLDRDGALASSGRVHEPTLEHLLADPFFARAAPKSLDRQTFAGALDAMDGLSAADGAATLVAFTARAIARLPLRQAPATIFVCGGGPRKTGHDACDRDGDRRGCEAGRDAGLGRGCARSAVFCVSRGPVAPGRAAELPGHDGRRPPVPGRPLQSAASAIVLRAMTRPT